MLSCIVSSIIIYLCFFQIIVNYFIIVLLYRNKLFLIYYYLLYNNQLSQLLPLNKEDLINIIEKELQDHSELYLGFYTKSREEFFSELSNYIKHKRYNSDICDIIPIVIANALKLKLKILNEKRHDSFETTIVEPFSASHTGVLFIHRKGDHYNGVVYRIYPRTVQSALHPPSARRVSCSAGTTLAPRPTRVRPSSSSARADPTHCPSRVRPPSSSTWANPAHCPTRVRPPSSSTRADPAHCPTRAGPTRADIPSSSTRAYPAHCPTRVRHPSSFTRADSAHLPTRAGPTRVCPSSSSAKADPAHCPTRVRLPPSSTRAYPAHLPTRAGPTRACPSSSSAKADPAHCPTRVRPPSSSTRAYPAHFPTRAGPTRVCPSSSSAKADSAHCPTRVRLPPSSTRAYPAHFLTRAGPTRVCPSSSSTRADPAHSPTRADPTRAWPPSSSTGADSAHCPTQANLSSSFTFNNGYITYSSDVLKSLANVPSSQICDRLLRKKLFATHLWRPQKARYEYDKSTSRQQVCNKNLVSFCLINARSICNKTLLIRDFIDDRNLDIIGFVETWFTDSSTVDIATLTKPGYELAHFPRLNRRGGGCGLMYKSTLTLVSSKQIQSEAFEGMIVILKTERAKTLRIVIIYRPPGSPIDILIEDFSNVLQDCSAHSDEIILAGDFNLHSQQKSRDYREFNELLETNGYLQHVKSSTHTSGNTLDLIITPANSKLLVQGVRTTSLISDHYAVECSLRCITSHNVTRKISYRKLLSVDREQYSSDLSKELKNIDGVQSYNEAALNLLNKHAPILSNNVVVRNHKPWYTKNIRLEKRHLRKLERSVKQRRIHRDILIKGVRQFSNLLKTTKSAYYTKSLEHASQATVHKTAAALMGSRAVAQLPKSSCDKELAERFSIQFTEKPIKLQKLMNTPLDDQGGTPQFKMLSQFKLLNPQDARKIMQRSTLKTAPHDPIPASLFKDNMEILIPYVCNIVNTSIKTCIVPPLLKHSVITPIYKQKQLDVEDVANYRPISQLPIMSKIMERHVAEQLQHHMNDNNINMVFQSAYRANHSTETALIRIHNDVTQALDQNRDVILILLDLKSAFDCLNHTIMINRLREIGISGDMLKWFESYLSGRTYSVKINQEYSNPVTSLHGVPQGSVLGPLLFNGYCLPLARVIEKHNIAFHMYADDTQLYLDFDPRDKNSSIARINACIKDIKMWLCANRLCINESKTEALLISKKETVATSFQNGSMTIPLLPSVTNLGAKIDNRCDMEKHALKMCTNACFHLQSIRKIRRCLTMESCKILVHSLVTSRLDYANILLCNAPDRVTARLERVQRSAARLIYGIHRYQRISITAVLHELHWLPVVIRIQYKVLVTVFKAYHSGTPQYLADLIKKHSPVRKLRSSHNPNLLEEPKYTGEKFGSKSFCVAGPRFWNRLPAELREISSLDTFKKHLKTHLFQKHYYTEN